MMNSYWCQVSRWHALQYRGCHNHQANKHVSRASERIPWPKGKHSMQGMLGCTETQQPQQSMAATVLPVCPVLGQKPCLYQLSETTTADKAPVNLTLPYAHEPQTLQLKRPHALHTTALSQQQDARSDTAKQSGGATRKFKLTIAPVYTDCKCQSPANPAAAVCTQAVFSYTDEGTTTLHASCRTCKTCCSMRTSCEPHCAPSHAHNNRSRQPSAAHHFYLLVNSTHIVHVHG